MTEQEIWLKTWLAAITCENCGSKSATEIADKCLEAYKQRFPEQEAKVNKREANRELLQAAKSALDALIWCGGSDDFCEGGKAYVGWENLAQPAIDRLQNVLKPLTVGCAIKLPEPVTYVGAPVFDGELSFNGQD
jgi:hypothetical protein